ncbi:hypothetical protein BDZ89DRAFT_1042221 [Hymenopellis radicata]|nr:hypothetical protein BDZ89DRAFT_1042221 [Hymenopellis radicata]
MARTTAPHIGGKKKYVKKAKSERGNRKGWMEGMRAKLFVPLVPRFADTVDTGWQAADEYMKVLQNLYHFHFPYPMKDSEEPAELKEYDPLKVVPDDDSGLTDDELRMKRAHITRINTVLRRWLVYHARRFRKRFRKLTRRDATDTYEILMARLSGVTKPPKQAHASHIFRRETEEQIKKAIAEKWEKVTVKKSKLPDVAFRNKVTDAMLKALPKEEQKRYETIAKAEGDRKKEEYQALLTAPPSRAPEDRAAAVGNLENFIGDINRGCEERTFMRLFTLAGGPTNESNGEISTKSYSTSKNIAPVPLSFQEWLGPTELAKLLGLWSKYLATCYTPEDRQSVIIPDAARGPLVATQPINGQTVVEGASGAALQPINGQTVVEGASGAALQVAVWDAGPEFNVDASTLMPMGGEEVTSVGGKIVTKAVLAKLLSLEDSDGDSSESDSGDESESDASDGELYIPQDNDVIDNGKKKKRKRAASVTEGTGAGWMYYDENGIRLSEEEIERNEAVVHQQLRKAGFEMLYETGMMNENTGEEDFVAAARKAIADGRLQDPALAPSKTRAKRPRVAKAKESGEGEGSARRRKNAGRNANGVATESTTGATSTATKDTPPATLPPVKATIIAPIVAPIVESSEEDDKRVCSELLKDAPSWLEEAVDEFMGAEGGDALLSLMRLLLEIERQHGWISVDEGKKFNLPGARMRPHLLTSWISNGRTRQRKRIVVDEKTGPAFVAAWKPWWSYLQESWRVRGEDGEWKRDAYGDEWKKMGVPGQNGMLSVVAVLSWWKSFIESQGSVLGAEAVGEKEWVGARNDVEWVLKGLLSHVGKKKL